MTAKKYYTYLLTRFADDRATEEEEAELMALIRQQGNDVYWEELIEKILSGAVTDPEYNPVDWQAMIGHILAQRQRKIRALPARKWAAAAILLLALAATAYLVWKPPAPNITASQPAHDLAPGSEGAILTLSDGRKIVLDSLGNGVVTTDGATRLRVQKGVLLYNAGQQPADAPVYNTINTPAGREYTVQLPDGSVVRLNAASSLRYPTAFTGTERSVTVTGEAYFEVQHNPRQPFTALVNGMEVTVLGTKFNIKAYDADSPVKTTLAEGKVTVNADGQTTVLQPGQQAAWLQGRPITTLQADMEEDLGWVNGYFVFRNADIATIMNEVARWYNVDVVYKNRPRQLFMADIPRNVTAASFFKILEATGWVRFTIEGNKVIVE